VAITNRLKGGQRLVVVAATVVLVTALATILAIRGYHTLLEETFRERSLAYAQAFAASAGAWVDPLDDEMLRTAAHFLLVGSASYVRIEYGGVQIVDEGADGASIPEFDSPADPLAAGETRWSTGSAVLDVLVPLYLSGQAVGTVRIGIDTVSTVARGRTVAMTAGGVALGVDLLVLALLFWSHRGSRRRRRGPSFGSDEASDGMGTLVLGNLRIDGTTKAVSLSGSPVKLTPKQYALLDFLARQADRVVSEREIVDAVWSESPYADSKDVKQYVYLLRKRLAAVDSRGRELIVTVPGFGYRLTSSPVDEGLTDGWWTPPSRDGH